MVNDVATQRAKTDAKRIVAEKLKEAEEYQQKLAQRRKWLLNVLTDMGKATGGIGFYGVTIILALLVGGAIAINIPYAVVCHHSDWACSLRVKGKSFPVEEILP
jgi:hypothetical protein